MEVLKLPNGPIMTNSYIISFNQKECYIVDPADGPVLQSLINEHAYHPVAILLTHGHFDHITGLPQLIEAFTSIPIFIHELDKPMLFDAILNGSSTFYSHFQLEQSIKTQSWNELTSSDREQWKILETPGHTPGSVTIQIQHHMFTGDFLFQESIGRTDFQYGSAKIMHTTLKHFVNNFQNSKENFIIHPGHGEETDLFHELHFNPFLIRLIKQNNQ